MQNKSHLLGSQIETGTDKTDIRQAQIQTHITERDDLNHKERKRDSNTAMLAKLHKNWSNQNPFS